MKNTYKIVMLPTIDNSDIGIHSSRGLVHKKDIHPILDYLSNQGEIKTQHLHILSNEEIKEGGVYMFNVGYASGIKQAEKEDIRQMHLEIEPKKIIASTDKSLNLPGIPQSYIEYYISEYNKGNVIEEIELKVNGWSNAALGYNEEVLIDIENNKILEFKAHSMTKEEYQEMIDKDPLEDYYYEYALKLQNNEVIPVYNTNLIFGDSSDTSKVDKAYLDLMNEKLSNMKDGDIIMVDNIELIKEQEQSIEIGTLLKYIGDNTGDSESFITNDIAKVVEISNEDEEIEYCCINLTYMKEEGCLEEELADDWINIEDFEIFDKEQSIEKAAEDYAEKYLNKNYPNSGNIPRENKKKDLIYSYLTGSNHQASKMYSHDDISHAIAYAISQRNLGLSHGQILTEYNQTHRK